MRNGQAYPGVQGMPPEILEGWKRVHSGLTEQGDRRWSNRYQAWLPIIRGDGFHGQPVSKLIMIVIRREER